MGKGFAVLEVDPEFKALIRPLRKDEYLQLEVNLSIDGCRDPIITWNNIIIDGHNRYEICNRLHIPYAVREMSFENRERAIVWICSNQLGRRNITEETRRYLIGKQYELEKVARKHPPNINDFNQYKRRNRSERGETFRRTAQKFSSQYNVSTGAVQKYAVFSKALDAVGRSDPELPGKIKQGVVRFSDRHHLRKNTLQSAKPCRAVENYRSGSVLRLRRVCAGMPFSIKCSNSTFFFS